MDAGGEEVRIRRAQRQSQPARPVRGPKAVNRLSRLLRARCVRLARPRLPRLLPRRRSGFAPGPSECSRHDPRLGSRATQGHIVRRKARMGWEMPWYTMTDSFDKDFGVDEWHGHNVFFRDADKVFRTYFVNNRADEAMGTVW